MKSLLENYSVRNRCSLAILCLTLGMIITFAALANYLEWYLGGSNVLAGTIGCMRATSETIELA